MAAVTSRICDVPSDIVDMDQVHEIHEIIEVDVAVEESPVLLTFDPVAGLSAKSVNAFPHPHPHPQSALLHSALIHSALIKSALHPPLPDSKGSQIQMQAEAQVLAHMQQQRQTSLLSAWSSSSGSCYDTDPDADTKSEANSNVQSAPANDSTGRSKDSAHSSLSPGTLAWITEGDQLYLEPSSESSGWASSSGGSYSVPSMTRSSRSSSLIGHLPSPSSSRADVDFTERRKISQPKVFFRPIAGTKPSSDPTIPSYVMAKTLQSDREMDIIRYLSSSRLRSDPWNPAPYLLSVVNPDDYDEEEPVAVFEPLSRLDDLCPLAKPSPVRRASTATTSSSSSSSSGNTSSKSSSKSSTSVTSFPISTRKGAIEFVIQLLQSLVFLHEHRVAYLNLNSDTVMVDLNANGKDAGDGRCRAGCDVRYYLVDFTHACVAEDYGQDHLFTEDLRDLGYAIEDMIVANVPEIAQISRKLMALDSSTMTSPDTAERPTAAQVLQELEMALYGSE